MNVTESANDKKVHTTEKEWVYREYINREDLILHAPYEPEMDFYNAVKNGDEDKVRVFLRDKFTGKEGFGTLSEDNIRNFKYHFIITAAMLSRTCIEAGLPLEQAYSLSDFYIQKVDKSTSLQDVDKLHARMVLDYTGLMKKLSKSSSFSKPVRKCLNYIYSHLHTRITLTELASLCGMSPSYLSKLFKQETGLSVSEYIEHQKLETAKNMLTFSDYTPGEISFILGFPSQSYFTERFRKATGVTPGKYIRQ